MAVIDDRTYFLALAEIDYLRWELETMLSSERRLSALDRAIDTATGFDREKKREAGKMMRRIRRLQKIVSAREKE